MHKMIALITFLTVALVASTAMAQGGPCAERDNVLAHLAKNYQETPIAVAVTSGGGLIEVLTNHKGGTWTIIVTTPEGISCMITSGEGWRNMEPIDLDPDPAI